MEPLEPERRLELGNLGGAMPRERRQNGWVDNRNRKTKKKTKTWIGYWYEYVKVGDVEKRRVRQKVIGSTSELTKGAAQDKLREHLRTERPPDANATFEQLGNWYLRTSAGRWSEKTKKTMSSIFRHQIYPRLGHQVAGKLTKSDIVQVLNEIAADAESQSYSVVVKCRTHIKACLEQAVEDKRLPYNPATKIRLPKTRKASQRFLTMPECRRLIKVARETSEREHLIVRLLLECGLRPSEVFALRDDDIGSGKLSIDEATVLGKVGDTKTEGSATAIPIGADLEAHLRAYAATRPAGYLFTRKKGGPIHQENYLTQVLKVVGRQAGIPDLNHQVLRRTAGTWMNELGGVKNAQSMLRHDTAATTMKHYVKKIDESLVATVNSWERALLSDDEPEGVAKVIPIRKVKHG